MNIRITNIIRTIFFVIRSQLSKGFSRLFLFEEISFENLIPTIQVNIIEKNLTGFVTFSDDRFLSLILVIISLDVSKVFFKRESIFSASLYLRTEQKACL